MTSAGIMASGVSLPSAVDVLLEPFSDYTTNAWVPPGDTNWTIVAARTGNGARGAGANNLVRYSIPSLNQSAYLTVGFAFKISNASGTRAMFRLESDSGTTSHLYVHVPPTGAVEIRAGGSAGNVLASSATGVIPTNTFVYVELQAVLDDTAGAVTLRVNGTQVAAATGIDTKNAGTKAVFDTLCLLSPASGINNIFDDLYVTMGPGATFKGSITIP